MRFNKIISLALFSINFLAYQLNAQNCDLSISGLVTDHETTEGLPLVNILVLETGDGAVSTEDGKYEIHGLCKGEYHVIFSHIGCEPEQRFVEVDSNLEVNIELEHSSKLLEGVVVTDKHIETGTKNAQAVGVQSITENANTELSRLISEISGVSTLRSGAGISKPIIHGLYGNRVTLLNNGIAQSGQQWGNDHSPEIDPLVASQIVVVKGTSALEFFGSNLGGVVMVEPKQLVEEPHLHGSTTYAFNSNGRGSTLNAQFNRTSFNWNWKLNGTYRINGDRHTPRYYLTNTGSREYNLALQLERSFNNRFISKVYFSSYNSQLGVLRGSHIGNLTDLENALEREEPFFTRDTFSYAINAPRQLVSHHLAKYNLQWFVKDDQWLEFNTAAQYNDRKEFDVRRSGRSAIPALSLQQWNYFAELKYNLEQMSGFKLKAGLQTNIIDNTNNPETGILPLIPDYLSSELASFLITNYAFDRNLFEFGVRYQYTYQDAPTFSATFPIEVVRYRNGFQTGSISAGWKADISAFLQSSLNIGYASRNPAINELYSAGLHQGVSGIEEGDENLENERSLKTVVSLQYDANQRFSFEALAYWQRINDFIFLKPTSEVRLTIRGAFPVFKYTQTDANIVGLDFSAQYQLTKWLQLKTTYAYVQGEDLLSETPIIYMPPGNLRVNLNANFAQRLSLGKIHFSNTQIGIKEEIVFRQSRFEENLDFLDPPAAYNLLGLSFSTDIETAKAPMRFFFSMDNVFNTVYRDYLNRQRYFADDLGRNITLGLNLKF